MKNLIFLMLLAPTVSIAAALVLTPGKPMQAITPTANGYNILDMGGNGVTQVMDLGGMTAIVGSNAPATFILHDSGAPTPEMLVPLPNTELALPIE
jgi:hypothetical protein